MKRASDLAVRDEFERLRTQSQALLSSDAPEVVHELRVSLRRLRVALRVFKSSFSEAEHDKVQRDLKWVFAELGQLRDLQLFRAACQERLIEGTPGASALDQQLQRQIAQRYKVLRRLLASERYRGLVQRLAAMTASPERWMHKRRWFERRLGKRHRRALHVLDVASADQRAIHSARKALKKLRYAAELGGQHFHEKDVQRYLKKVKRVQGALGDIVDLRVWQNLARKQCRKRALRELFTAEFGRERDLALAGFEPHARRLAKTEPFWTTA
jgi:CHAD domain-containing protein